MHPDLEAIPEYPLAEVIKAVGEKPPPDATQHTTRHYSESFSKEVALWLRKLVLKNPFSTHVMTPEAKVRTIYGGKSLDVGVKNAAGYLLMDFSIKTFNFKDRKTRNYRHNYTGRFYELLGEELDVRRSYRLATLVALILLPEDSTTDSKPSSFAHAVRQFSKIAVPSLTEESIGFEFVFVGVYGTKGSLYFFDSRNRPPKSGHPPASLTIHEVLGCVYLVVKSRIERISTAPLPVYLPYKFEE